MPILPRPHRSFGLVLAGGGARGFAHLGVLRALEHAGYRPSRLVGVSMGALVGVAYALRVDWYRAVLDMSLDDFPGTGFLRGSGDRAPAGTLARIQSLYSTLRSVLSMVTAWGPGTRQREVGLAELRRLVGRTDLVRARVPITVTATDLTSGERVVLDCGPADTAVYASAALAGILPPLEAGSHLLADGAYSDLAPVDLAKTPDCEMVVAVDAGMMDEAPDIRNGYRAIMRAMEICHRQHARLRFSEADLVLRPVFRNRVDALDFGARRECVAAGTRVVRRERETIDALLGPVEGEGGTSR